ncbi:MAG: peptide deformylase [Rhodobacterales bacterium]|nr:peptide deformylase [Rhodobacterales bacterium]
MSILKVARMGHPVLRQVSRPIEPEEYKSPEFQRFCDDLLETMDEYEGAGLAAPQVHMPVRVVVLVLSDEPEFLVNPVITHLTEECDTSWEGCLSVPEMRGRVSRPNHIRLEAFDRFGKPKAYELQGFPAVVTQHECDHLDGILYVDRVEPRTLSFLEEYRRYANLDDYGEFDDEDIHTEEEE